MDLSRKGTSYCSRDEGSSVVMECLPIQDHGRGLSFDKQQINNAMVVVYVKKQGGMVSLDMCRLTL